MLSRRALLAVPVGQASRPVNIVGQASRPVNLVVFMTDQESALLPGPASLPNRTRLLKRGTQFTHAFCNTPQCSPARASLLTGLEPHRAGVLTNVDGSSVGKALSPQVPTVGSVFQNAGYTTGYFGKWHLSAARVAPTHFGFSTYQAGSDHQTTLSACDWIRKQKQPWLCWISVLDPHHIYDIPGAIKTVEPRPGVRPPHSGLNNLSGKPSEQRWFVDDDQGRQTREYSRQDWLRYRSFYLSLVEKTDRLLGVVLDTIGDLPATAVVYTTDHGDALGEHGLPYKGPFMYEELIRIPWIISTPGFTARHRDDFVRQTDLAPTLASLAGLRWPSSTDGRDLTQPGPAPDAVLLEYYAKQQHVNPIRTIRTRRWKLNWYDSGHKELYDLQVDPHELTNLAGRAPVPSELERRLDAWRPPLTRPQA